MMRIKTINILLKKVRAFFPTYTTIELLLFSSIKIENLKADQLLPKSVVKYGKG